MITHRTVRLYLLQVVFFLSFPLSAATLSFSTDNDSLIGTDRDYTGGLFFTYSSQLNQSNWGYGVALAIQAWTPADITQPIPAVNERPYASAVSVQGKLFKQYPKIAYKYHTILGMVGPDSGAEQVQSLIHELIGSPSPKGWAYQISNQAIFQLGAEGHYNLFRYKFGELSLFGRAQAGNFQSEVAIGSTYRIGFDLENSFGSIGTSPENIIDVGMFQASPKGAFFFLSVEAKYRFNDITIEGQRDTFHSDLEIDPKQLSFGVGITWYRPKWGITLSSVIQTRQMKTTSYQHHSFGSIGLFYRY